MHTYIIHWGDAYQKGCNTKLDSVHDMYRCLNRKNEGHRKRNHEE
jgi:hypothetical protein